MVGIFGGTQQKSAKDLAGFTKIKYRSKEQLASATAAEDEVTGAASSASSTTVDDRRSQLRAKLDAAEAKELTKGGKGGMSSSHAVLTTVPQPQLLAIKDAESRVESTVSEALQKRSRVDVSSVSKKYDDSDEDFGRDSSDEDEDGRGKGGFAESSDEDDDEEEDDDDEDDDEAELQRELERIKREREEARQRQEAAAREAEAKAREGAALSANPLVSLGDGAAGATSMRMKRRWNDDVVFRNQAKQEDPEQKKRFINDTVRSDFHRRFMDRYIK